MSLYCNCAREYSFFKQYFLQYEREKMRAAACSEMQTINVNELKIEWKNEKKEKQ